jgi:hypothetical protein
MNEIRAVDLAVVDGSWDMTPMARRDDDRVTAAAKAMGLRPN